MTNLDKFCRALNEAHASAVEVEAKWERLKLETQEAHQAYFLAKSVLENAKDDLLRAVGEPVDDKYYRRGIE